VYIECNDDINTKSSGKEKIMAKTAVIQTRVDPAVKQRAQIILKKLNISMSEAISMYLSQITLHNGIPFELKIPNDITAKTLMDADNGDGLHTVDSIDDLFQELDN
jgi:DNA-damage-inducible protein J